LAGTIRQKEVVEMLISMKIHIIHTMKIEVTRATARGQVVIPQEIRKETGVKEGTQFLVYTEGDTIVLKPVLNTNKMKALQEFEKVLAPLRKKAAALGLTEKDVEAEIQAYRRERHAKSGAGY
jgi:AbrB family looped-hinge helix DNA binding protein